MSKKTDKSGSDEKFVEGSGLTTESTEKVDEKINEKVDEKINEKVDEKVDEKINERIIEEGSAFATFPGRK